MTFSIQNSESISALDVMNAACDVGSTNAAAQLVFYDGTPPARVGEALAGNNVLAICEMSNPAYLGAVDVPASNLARATADAISSTTILQTGTATFARILNRDEDPVQQLSVGVSGSGAGVEIPTVNLVEDAALSVTALVINMPESA